jgi:DNA-binding GntR family transcriptional regulator
MVDPTWANTPERRKRPGADAVYATLRDAIVSGQLRPGDRLAEVQLARQFEVSRTPVREAIFRLEAEHFAERHARRGLIVRGIPEQEVLEVYAVRTWLDGLAARVAAEHAQPADHARLRWLNARLAEAIAEANLVTAAELNIQFHEAIGEAARNSMLLHFMRQLHDWVRRFGGTTFSVPERAAQALAEHVGIIDAIEQMNPDVAEQGARAHMTHAHEVRLAMLRQTQRLGD